MKWVCGQITCRKKCSWSPRRLKSRAWAVIHFFTLCRLSFSPSPPSFFHWRLHGLSDILFFIASFQYWFKQCWISKKLNKGKRSNFKRYHVSICLLEIDLSFPTQTWTLFQNALRNRRVALRIDLYDQQENYCFYQTCLRCTWLKQTWSNKILSINEHLK